MVRTGEGTTLTTGPSVDGWCVGRRRRRGRGGPPRTACPAGSTPGTPPGTDALRGQAGFTLLELVLVLVLVSLVLALAAPSLRGFADARRTADAASRLLALTHWARSQAVTEGCLYRLNIEPVSGTYWLTAQRSGAFVELEGEYGRLCRLPDGVTVSVDAPLSEAAETWIQFYPTGRCDEAAIDLLGRQGERFRVICESATERFRIATAEEMQDR